MRPRTRTWHRPEVVVAALTNREGTMTAGATYRTPVSPKRREEPRNGVVVQTREPVRAWACDDCEAQGWGLEYLYQHALETEHRRYTKLVPPCA